MGAKQLTYSDEARQSCSPASASFAPCAAPSARGRNAVIDKGWGSPNVTKDGVTVAEEIELQDPYENMGAQLVKEAASKTSDVAGDGTTTATVLAEAIYREGLKNIAAGADPMALTRGIQKGVERVVEELHQHGREDRRQGRQGNHRSRHHRRQQQRRDRQEAGRGDEEGRRLQRRHHRRRRQDGRDRSRRRAGHAVRSRLSVAALRHQPGNSASVELENPYILIYEEKISSAKSLIPLLETISKKKEPLLHHRRGH